MRLEKSIKSNEKQDHMQIQPPKGYNYSNRKIKTPSNKSKSNNTQFEYATLKFYSMEDYTSIYFKQETKRSFKYKLFEIRKFFLYHNTLFIFIKIFLGMLVFGLPIFLFKKNAKSNNSDEYNQISNYSSSAAPLFCSILGFMLYIAVLIVIKFSHICKNKFLFPPWERFSFGMLFFTFFICFGIFFFIINLVECLSYLDTLREKLFEGLQSGDIITSTTAKILLYNIFDQKILNLGNLSLSNEVNDLNNLTLALTNNNITLTSNLISHNHFDSFNPDRKDLVIFDILIKLYRPVLFICVLSFIKIILFTSKRTVYSLIFIFCFVSEYFFLRLGEGKESSINNLYKSIPIYLFLITYISYIIHSSLFFLKKYSGPIKKLKIKYRVDHHSILDKIIIIFFDFIVILSLILFILALSQDFSSKNHIKLMSLIASTLFIIGSSYKIGKFTLELAFYSIEKEYFPATLKKFYISCDSIKYSKDKNSADKFNYCQEEGGNEMDPLIYNSS